MMLQLGLGLNNDDLEPMPRARRIWGFWSFFGYWGVPNITIWTWSTGSALLALGLSVSHIMGALTVGNIIICVYTCLSSNPGLRYHIGYSVSQRLLFGIYGSYIGIVLRVLLAVIFYGVQSWLGGLSVVVILSSWSRLFMEMEVVLGGNLKQRDFIGYVIFQIVQMGFFFIKPEKMNRYVNISCVMTVISFVAVMVVCLAKNGDAGTLFYEKGTSENTGWMWMYAISIWYGALCPDILNLCDFSRFGNSYTKTYAGIICLIMITGTFVPLASLLVASATKDLYGAPIWLPTDLSLLWLEKDYNSGCRAANFFLGLAFCASQLTFNVVANGFGGGMNLAGMVPQYIDIKRGAIIVGMISWVVQPWNFYNTVSVFMNVMSSFGVIITPIIALSICDFMIVRKQEVFVEELYSLLPLGEYYFTLGFNLRAIMVWLVSVAPGIPGLIDAGRPINIPVGLDNFFYGSVVFSFALPFGLYYIVCRVFPYPSKPKLQDSD